LIYIAQVQEKEVLLLVPCKKQDLLGLESERHLSTVIMTQTRMPMLSGLTKTAGHTLTYE